MPTGLSLAKDISETGAVVGWSRDNITYRSRAVQWEDGEMADLGTGHGPGSASTAYDINDAGLVAGSSKPTQSGRERAVIWVDGAMTELGTLGGNHTATSALDINDHGQVVGSSPTTDRDVHAFLWDDRDMTDLGVLGEPGSSSFAYGINNSSQVVGTLAVDDLGATFYRAFLWDESGPSGTLSIRNRKVTFTFSAPDADTAGFECSLNAAAFASCTSPQAMRVPRGAHTFTVRAIDRAGNHDQSPPTRMWTIQR